MSSLLYDVGFTGRKPGPEQTRKLPEYIHWGTRAMRRRQFYSANGFVSKIERQMFFSMAGHRMSKTLITIKLQKTAPVCTIMPVPFPSCYWKYLQLRGEMGGKHEA
ncbi:hypothetical protein LXL04_033878 [Taraxacum kok-saghyz]